MGHLPCCSAGAPAGAAAGATVLPEVAGGLEGGAHGSPEGKRGGRSAVSGGRGRRSGRGAGDVRRSRGPRQAVEQLGEQPGVGLGPAGEGTRAPTPRAAPGRRRAASAPASVRLSRLARPSCGIGPAHDVARPLEGGELAAGDGDVDARVGGEGAAALVALALQRARAAPSRRTAGRRRAGRPPGTLTCRPVRTSCATIAVRRSRVSGLTGMGCLHESDACRTQPYA